MGVKAAKGSLSFINWATETAYGTAPTSTGSNYFGLPFVSEALDISTNSIVSAEIRPDRTVPGVRQGNRQSGGTLTTDFGINRFVGLMQHLLGGGSFVTTTITPSALAAATYVRGDLVTSSSNLYLCIVGGTETGSPSLTATSGEQQLAGGTKWAYVGAAATAMYRHVLTAGASLPTGGLSIEKGIVGGDAALYQMMVGGRINSLRLTVPQDGLVQAVWDVLFQRALPSTSSPATSGVVVSDSPIMGYESMISLNGTENYDLRDAMCQISNNISGTDFRIGSRDRKVVTEARRELTGNFTAYFTDATLFNVFANETVMDLIFSWYRSGNFMSLEFPETKFMGTPLPKVGGPGVITSAFDLQSFRQNSSYDAQLVIKTTLSAANLQSQMGAF